MGFLGFFCFQCDIYRILVPKDAHILIPRTCEHYITGQRVINVTDGTEVANRLTWS